MTLATIILGVFLGSILTDIFYVGVRKLVMYILVKRSEYLIDKMTPEQMLHNYIQEQQAKNKGDS